MKKKNEEKWITPDGNKCFRFSERKEFERLWLFVFPAILLCVGTCIELLVNGSYYSLMPNVIILFFFFLWWATIPLKANEVIIEKIVHELMDDIVEADAKAAGTEVVKSFVHYDTKGTYAIITGRCFLVLLKNNEVWEYPIVYHKPNKKEEGYYECEKKYVVSENLEHIRAVHPRRWYQCIARLKLSDKTKLCLLLIAIILIGGVTFACVYWLIMRLRWWILLLIGGFFVLYEITEWSAKLLPGKFMEACKKVVSLPIVVLYFVVSTVQPFITIMGAYFFVTIFVFGVVAIILTGINTLGWIILKPETIVFVVIALGSVFSSTYSVTKWIIEHTPLKNWGNHDYESYREQLAFYMVHPSNMVFLIYLIYFVFLAVSGYLQIQFGNSLISKEFDYAILKAFLVYIAFTNMRTKAENADLDVKELLKRTLLLFERDK